MNIAHRTELLDVLCLLPDLGGGGAQRTMVNLVNAFPAFAIAPTLAAVRADGYARHWLRREEDLVDLGAGRTRAAIMPLRRLIRARRPQILLSTMVDANIIAAAACQGLSARPPLIVRETNSHRMRGDLGWVRRRAAGWAYRKADRVVALSSGVATELTETYRLRPDSVITIHNPVDVDAITERARRARRAAPPWAGTGRFAHGQGPVLIGVGRLARQKGFDLLLDALALCANAETRLIVLGDGCERAALELQVRRLGLDGRVLMPGFVEDPAPWLAHADIFVLSSRWEGFGHVIVEAMAAGTTVVATDCPYGPVDIIRPDETGMLIDAGDARGIAAAVDALLADPGRAKELARKARSDCRRFGAAAIAGRYASLFRSVVAHRLETFPGTQSTDPR